MPFSKTFNLHKVIIYNYFEHLDIIQKLIINTVFTLLIVNISLRYLLSSMIDKIYIYNYSIFIILLIVVYTDRQLLPHKVKLN